MMSYKKGEEIGKNRPVIIISDSDAMIEQLRSLSKSRVSKKLTTLAEQELKKIEDSIKSMLNL